MPETPINTENLFRSLIKNHSSVMLVIAPLSGKIMYANKAAQDFYGYPLSTLMKMNISEINQLPSEEIKNKIKQALEGRNNHFIVPHKLASGDIRTVEVNASVISIESLDYLFSIVHDITDRIRAEDKLRRSEERLEFAKECSGAGIWDWDIISGKLK